MGILQISLTTVTILITSSLLTEVFSSDEVPEREGSQQLGDTENRVDEADLANAFPDLSESELNEDALTETVGFFDEQKTQASPVIEEVALQPQSEIVETVQNETDITNAFPDLAESELDEDVLAETVEFFNDRKLAVRPVIEEVALQTQSETVEAVASSEPVVLKQLTATELQTENSIDVASIDPVSLETTYTSAESPFCSSCGDQWCSTCNFCSDCGMDGNLYPHYAYLPEYHGYYYFHPYNYENVLQDRAKFSSPLHQIDAPYSTAQFAQIYKRNGLNLVHPTPVPKQAKTSVGVDLPNLEDLLK